MFGVFCSAARKEEEGFCLQMRAPERMPMAVGIPVLTGMGHKPSSQLCPSQLHQTLLGEVRAMQKPSICKCWLFPLGFALLLGLDDAQPDW